MNTNMWIYVAVGLIAVAGLIVAANQSKQGTARFKAKKLLTTNEMEFLARLESAVPEFRFHAQVAMGALIEPAVSQKQDSKTFWRLRGMFSQKIVDYVAQSRATGEIVAIIELDDKTHNAEKDAKRDAMVSSAGYRTVRWHSAKKPTVAAIRAELLSTQK